MKHEVVRSTDLSVDGHGCVLKYEISTKEKYQSVKNAEKRPVNEHPPAQQRILGNVSVWEEEGRTVTSGRGPPVQPHSVASPLPTCSYAASTATGKQSGNPTHSSVHTAVPSVFPWLFNILSQLS